MLTKSHPAPNVDCQPSWRQPMGRRPISALLLFVIAVACAPAVRADEPAATDHNLSADDRDLIGALASEGAGEPGQLPEPKGSPAATSPTIQFRREAPANRGEAPANDRPRRPWRAPANTSATPVETERGASSTAREVAAVEATAKAYRDAVAEGDVEAISKFWTPEADYVDQAGHSFHVSEKLKEARGKQRDGKSAGRGAQIDPGYSIRIVTPGVALEDGSFQRSATADGEPVYGRYTAVWVKRDGRWLLDGVRESAVVELTPADHLQGLQWLVGEWHGEGAGLTADVSCAWGPEKNYLLQKTVLRSGAGNAESTIQWIGWDPVQKQIRSFVFDSAGGFEDGVWAKDGEAWVATIQGVLADGRQTTHTNIYSRVDADNAIWEIVEDEIAGDEVDDVRIDFKRKAKAAE